ncbi:hypothetical protein EON65_30515 [archaeon]|nr:MAG: hypothetical protein EON65_30515 [archaeon]
MRRDVEGGQHTQLGDLEIYLPCQYRQQTDSSTSTHVHKTSEGTRSTLISITSNRPNRYSKPPALSAGLYFLIVV